MNQFGELIREQREKRELLLRELAAQLDMDTALLSKIERGERKARKEQLGSFAKVLNYDVQELETLWLADKIYNFIEDEEMGIDALHLAEKEINYKKENK